MSISQSVDCRRTGIIIQSVDHRRTGMIIRLVDCRRIGMIIQSVDCRRIGAISIIIAGIAALSICQLIIGIQAQLFS